MREVGAVGGGDFQEYTEERRKRERIFGRGKERRESCGRGKKEAGVTLQKMRFNLKKGGDEAD